MIILKKKSRIQKYLDWIMPSEIPPEEGLPAAIERKKRVTPPREIQFRGEFEAHLLALACTEAPKGRDRWTMRLLAEKMVELKMVPSVSPMTVCNTLKKMNLNLT